MSKKQLELKGGKIVITDKEKEPRVRKNYSLPQSTIDAITELSEKLGCNSSEAITEAVRVVNALLEEPKEPKKTSTRGKNKSKKVVETTDIEDEDEPF